MADDNLWYSDLCRKDGSMDWPLEGMNYPQDIEDDIFTLDALAPEQPALQHISLPDIRFQPPTRNNTVAVVDQGRVLGAESNELQPWNPLAVGIAGSVRDAAMKDVSVSSSLTSNLPSDDGTSVTSFPGSNFASQESCEICNVVYKNNSNRRKHILTHTKPHKCRYPECKRSIIGFATPNDLERHNSCVHKNGLKKWWKCAYPGCLKTSKLHCFDRKDNFIAHIKRRHIELLTSDIESLVNRSQHVPSSEEIAAALEAKKCKAPGLAASSQKSSRGSVRRKRRVRKTMSETLSPHGPASPVEDIPQVENSPSRSVPSMPFLQSSPIMPNELAFMGAGASFPESSATSYMYRSIETGQDWSSPRWEECEKAASPQQMFQPFARQPFSDRRLFNSVLSDQMGRQKSHRAIPRSHDATHEIGGMQGLSIPLDNGMSMQSTQPWMGGGAFSTPGSSNVSFSSSQNELASPSIFQASSQRMFSYSPGPVSDDDMLDANFLMFAAYQSDEHFDEG